ncbi:MAG: L-threonylcarbamoyladenylate synthase [Defluviitaleaceae bacterium]|nr:L-threonylcarbamoyladenylate synthase [Defluviitaleaceae bacterium]MCL2263274.1 L-threonylcarbamoyladenylate synthase [Defluviitaleaceae bacterium]
MHHKSVIAKASEHLCKGGLVVFPTETVYGLGADAFNAEAVAQVYSEKGRPGDNPLILHIANMENFRELSHQPPQYAFALAEAFWPGPLTLVARKNPALPAWLGGHPSRTTETIGIRMPAHPIAQSLLEESKCIIAAPSANKAGKPSPTTLAHVMEDFPNSGIFPLDGGSATVGLESTVVDVTGDAPIILRPGFITEEQIFKTLGTPSPTPPQGISSLDPKFLQDEKLCEDERPRSPGMKYKHYAPRADMTLVNGDSERVAGYVLGAVNENPNAKIGILIGKKTLRYLKNAPPSAKILLLGDNEKDIAHNLFARLREFDKLDVDIIFAETTPENGLGVAIMDRMRKAAEGRVVYV